MANTKDANTRFMVKFRNSQDALFFPDKYYYYKYNGGKFIVMRRSGNDNTSDEKSMECDVSAILYLRFNLPCKPTSTDATVSRFVDHNNGIMPTDIEVAEPHPVED